MVFFKIALRNLGRVRFRTILTVLAIALGTALLTGITILNDSYLDSYINGVSNQLGYTDIAIKKHSDVEEGYFTVDDFEDKTDFKDIEGYEDYTTRIVEKHLVVNFPIKSEADAYETTFFGIDVDDDEGYGYAEILDTIDEVDDDDTIEDILSENPKYCVITSWIEEVYDFEIGENILIPHRIDNSTDYTNSSTWKSYKIAAIINDYAEGWDVRYDYELDEPNRVLVSRAIYVDIREARKMLNVSADNVNLLYIHVNLDKLDEYGAKLQDELPSKYFGDNIKAGEFEHVRDSIRSMQLILIIFTMISFIIAGMLTTNTLMMSIAEQKYEVGVMRAQGIYKKEIFKMFLFEALLLSLMGAILGILMGLSLSPILKQIFFTTIMQGSNFDLILIFNPISISIILAVSFIVSLLIGVIPAFLATKIHIIEAIRNISTSKRGKKFSRLLFPIVGAGLLIFGYLILTISYRSLIWTLIGIIPFITGLIILSTVLIPLLSRGFSHIFVLFLGPFRKLTDQNLKRDPKQTKISFIMFGLAIGFLVMISNVLYSLEKVQYNAMPRYLGADIVLYSEGSTFGMDELLKSDTEIIDGAVEEVTLLNGIRVKVDGYGTWKDEAKEPRVNLYIIEGKKFEDTVNDIEMLDSDGLSNKKLFEKLDDDLNTAIISKQLADKNHINKKVGDDIEVEVDDFAFDLEVIGITEFVSGFSETWEEEHDITPANKEGIYCVFVSWNTIKPLIDKYFDWLPESDLVIKGDNHDYDFWDFPLLNRTYTREILTEYAINNGYDDDFHIAERIWDENKTSIVSNSSIDSHLILDEINSMNVHIAFENTSLKGTTEFLYKRHQQFETVQDALKNGTDQCVITSDINNTLGVKIDDKISVWYENSTGDPVRKNLTVAGVIQISTTIEAINFHSQNPYIAGNWDVASDDTTAVLVDIALNASNDQILFYKDFFNHSYVYEFWIKLDNYFSDHLKIIDNLRDLLGSSYVIADMKWILTRDFAYAPGWMIQVNEKDYTQEEALEKVKEYLLENKMPAIYWRTVDDLREQYSDQINFQKAFFNIVLSFALIIAILGIMINMLISISNRKRELGIMRAIGTYKKELIKMILGETLILVLSGFLIGTIMGTLAANQLLLGLPLDPIFDLKLFIDYWMIFNLFGIVIVISIISAE
ncbi:MAG: FtsX-like permease family protein, partial [Candidatus Hermodarchaeota archaeon]